MNEEIAKKTIQEMMDKEKNNKAKKSLKDTMSDLYQNFGLILGFVVFMVSLGVIFGFVTYTIVGIRQMLDGAENVEDIDKKFIRETIKEIISDELNHQSKLKMLYKTLSGIKENKS